MVAAAASKRRRISIFWRTFSDQVGRDVESLSAFHRSARRSEIASAGSCRRRNGSWAGRSAFAFDKRAGQHFAEGPRLRMRLPRRFEVGVAGHIPYDTNNSVRNRPSQGLPEICKNAPYGQSVAKILRMNGFRSRALRPYGIAGEGPAIPHPGFRRAAKQRFLQKLGEVGRVEQIRTGISAGQERC